MIEHVKENLVIYVGIIAAISELLPLIKGFESNGLLQMLYNTIKKFAKKK